MLIYSKMSGDCCHFYTMPTYDDWCKKRKDKEEIEKSKKHLPDELFEI